ncbi:MAG: RluA family pseudouridine synthase [Hydrogenothermaceae bacterium]|nr:RluA family pseudouridine synthase [Hydrogenothermaceae bacterium]
MENFEVLNFDVKEEFREKRLDQFLALVYPEYSRSYYQSLLKSGNVLVDGIPILKASYKINVGQTVTVNIPPPEPMKVTPESIPIKVYYEDEDLAVVHKPAGMVVHPSVGHTSGTLVNALLHHFKNVSLYQGIERAGIVHRLDKDTEGIIVVAKTEFAHKELQKMFAERLVDKRYKAVVVGIVKKDYGLIDIPIGRSSFDRQKIGTVSNNLRDALTEFWVEKRSQQLNITLVDIKLHTGRTHQIRVHFSTLGYPLFNDYVYGFKLSNVDRSLKEVAYRLKYQSLVAYRLSFKHPRTGETLDFHVEDMPPQIKKLEELIG